MYFFLTLALLEMFTLAGHMFSSFPALVSNPKSATAYFSEQFYQNSSVIELNRKYYLNAWTDAQSISKTEKITKTELFLLFR